MQTVYHDLSLLSTPDSERKERVSKLATQAKTDPSVIPELWEMVERLIQAVCRKYCRVDKVERLYDYDDLCQSAYFGFLKAIEVYDPERGAFPNVLIYEVRNSCRVEIGLRGKRDFLFDANSLNETLSQDGESDLSRIDALPDPDAGQPFENVDDLIYNDQLHVALDDCMSRIPHNQADLLRTRYYDGVILDVIASECGISREGARQNIEKALDSMRKPENAAQLEAYRQNIIDSSLKLSSQKRFRDTWYSSVEWAAEKLVLKGV